MDIPKTCEELSALVEAGWEKMPAFLTKWERRETTIREFCEDDRLQGDVFTAEGEWWVATSPGVYRRIPEEFFPVGNREIHCQVEGISTAYGRII